MKTLHIPGLPLVPSDNRLARHGFNSYASAEYKEWLQIVRPILLDALGPNYQPDGESWWGVTIRLRLNQGDGPNRQKGILDWLSGRYPLERATEINGKKRQKGALVNGVGLWVDDKRVRYVLPFVEAVRCGEPSCDVLIRQVPAPVDEREAAATAVKAAKARAVEEAGERMERDILCELGVGDCSVAELAEALGVGATAVRRRLESLAGAGTIRAAGRGRWELAGSGEVEV